MSRKNCHQPDDMYQGYRNRLTKLANRCGVIYWSNTSNEVIQQRIIYNCINFPSKFPKINGKSYDDYVASINFN